MRRDDVARLAGVPASRVVEVSADDVRRAFADTASATVVEVATQEVATYWLAGGRYWLDDPYFGDVVAIDELAYSSELGLCHRSLLEGE
jgi:hypothetical protein